MYNIEVMKPLVQKQLSRYISVNENIEKKITVLFVSPAMERV
jgi:hypothetical protein